MQDVATIANLLLLVVAGSSLGIELLDHGGGALVATEGALIKGTGHGYFAMIEFYQSLEGTIIFFAAS